jgi:hypothetical protein
MLGRLRGFPGLGPRLLRTPRPRLGSRPRIRRPHVHDCRLPWRPSPHEVHRLARDGAVVGARAPSGVLGGEPGRLALRRRTPFQPKGVPCSRPSRADHHGVPTCPPRKKAARWTTLRLVLSKGRRVRSCSIGRETFPPHPQSCCSLIARARCRLSLQHALLPTQAQPASQACSKKRHSPPPLPGWDPKPAEFLNVPSAVDGVFNVLPRQHVVPGA